MWALSQRYIRISQLWETLDARFLEVLRIDPRISASGLNNLHEVNFEVIEYSFLSKQWQKRPGEWTKAAEHRNERVAGKVSFAFRIAPVVMSLSTSLPTTPSYLSFLEVWTDSVAFALYYLKYSAKSQVSSSTFFFALCFLVILKRGRNRGRE